MSVNLINENELHKYLKQSIVGYQKPADFSAENLKSPEYIKKYSEEISEAIVYQWMKVKFRNYLTQNEKASYLEPVKRLTKSPTWAMKAQLRGETLYRFNPVNVSFDKLRQLGRARMFLKKVATTYIMGQLEKSQPKIRLDFLKTDHKIDTMEKVLAGYNQMISRIDFESGTKEVMKFVDGFKIVQLLDKKAFEAEARGMDHCLARDGYYDAYAKSDKFYSLRDRQNEPHVTIQVNNGMIVQANGKGAMAINGRYHGYILNFITQNKLKVSDFAHVDMGLIKIGDETMSIHHLPKNKKLKLENLDISDYHLNKIPDFRNIEVSGTFDISNSSIKNLKGCPQAKSLSIYDSTNFDEDFLKDLPESVEKIDGYGMPIKCLKHLPQNISSLTIDLYNTEANPNELYDIPYHLLRKIQFDGANKEFMETFDNALQDGADFRRFYTKFQLDAILRSAGLDRARA